MIPAEPEGPCTAWVGLPPDGKRTRYYEGLAPELTGGVDTRREMPPGVVVLAVPYGDGRWDVARYAADGASAGDTHHDDWSDVIAQLQDEYVSDLAFTLTPGDVDVRSYASELATSR